MHHHHGTAERRSESDILAAARSLQARHGRGTFGFALRRLRAALARPSGAPGARELTVH